MSWLRGAIVSTLLCGLITGCAQKLPTEKIAIKVHEGTVLGFDLSPHPSADIHNTRRIRWVMQAGQLLDREGIKAVLTHR
jgi:hypothetical protein